MLSFFKSLVNDQDGATAIEYGLIAGLIAVAIVAAVSLIGTDLNTLFTTIDGKIAGANG